MSNEYNNQINGITGDNTITDPIFDFYDEDDPLGGEDLTSEEGTTDSSETESFQEQSVSEDTFESEETSEGDDDEDGNIFDDNFIKEDHTFDDYNDLALVALSLKDEDPDLFEFEIDKDIKPDVLVSSLKTQLGKAKERAVIEEREKYGEAARYLDMMLNGGQEDEISTAMEFGKIGNIQLQGNESEEDLANIVKYWLYRKGTPETDINDLVEIYKDRGVLHERAQESIEFHRYQEAAFIHNWQEKRNADINMSVMRQRNYETQVRNIIEKGSAKGMPIKDKQAIQNAIFKPTELVEYTDNSGNRRQTRVPLLQAKMNEFQGDLEQQVAFQLLLLNGFDFSDYVAKAEKNVNNKLIDVLNNRTTTTGRSKSSNYFEN